MGVTREEEIKERHDTFDVQYFYPGSGKYFGEASEDMAYILARNEELQRRVEKMERALRSAKPYSKPPMRAVTGYIIPLGDYMQAIDAKDQDDD